MTTLAPDELYAVEHRRGLHRYFAPASCTECEPAAAAVTGEAVTTPPPPSSPSPGNLGPALQRIRRGIQVDQPDESDLGPLTPDGNPWCDLCHGARQLAVRTPRQPTTYRRCPECETAGWAIQQRVDRLLGSLPPRFATWRLGTFPFAHPLQQRMLDRVRAWLDDPEPSWLFLWGPTDRGKTGLAVGLLYELALHGQSTALKIAPDLLTTIKASFGADGDDSESHILEALVAVDAFALDDLGAEYHRGPEDWAAEKIFQVIGGRHAALKRTIITSNYSLEQLQDRLGHPRTLRRIVEMTGSRWILDFRQLPSLGTGTRGGE
jgi:DNA replication protein DnaC